MNRKLIVTAALAILLSAPGAMAQEGRWQEISVQGTGSVPSDSVRSGWSGSPFLPELRCPYARPAVIARNQSGIRV